ncbi:MAG: penicillin-binding protein 2 [candidate division WOR-3 bacterium]
MAWAGLFLYVGFVQLVRGAYYRREAETQHWLKVELPAPRGGVFDRAGRSLARSKSSCSVQLWPRYAASQETLAAILARFGLGEQREIARQMAERQSFYSFCRHIDYRAGEALRQVLLKRQYHNCAYVNDDFKREYPYRSLGADVVGFVSDNRGRAGIEAEYDSILRGRAGWALLLRDAVGQRYPHPSLPRQEAVKGADIYLTLDMDVQEICRDALAAAVEGTEAISGSVVVLDARTGAVLGLVDYPGYDPTEPGRVPKDWLKLAAVSDQFEPGSSFKLVVCAAALESRDAYRLVQRTYDVSSGYVEICGRKIRDVHPNGVLDFDGLFVKSSNAGCAMLSLQLDPAEYYELARGLGFGSVTGLGLPNEGSGYLDKPNRLKTLRFANVVFGQGVTVTLLQLAAAYLCVANDGVYLRPYLLDSVKQGSRVLRRTRPTAVRRVLRPENCKRIKDILERVVTEGTGTLARIEGVSCCGKTGTAQKVEPWGGYSNTRSRMTFVGFLPKEEPRFVIAVLIDEPRTERFAGAVCCPVFSCIGSQLIRWERAATRRARLFAASWPSPDQNAGWMMAH